MKPRFPWAFVGPHLFLFAIFLFIPIVAIFGLSFYDWDLLGGHRFIGLSNYAELLSSRSFWRALGNTFLFATFIVPGTMIAGLVLALLLNRPLPGRSILRACIYLPFVISGIASGTIAAWMLNDHYGVINAFLNRISLPGLPWLSSVHLAMPSVIMTNIWLRSGLCMVVYLAALQDVPKSQLEAAELDGAGAWNRFRHVVWPILKPSTTFLLVTNLIYSLHIFDVIYVMTEGGPGGSTTVLVQYLYDQAFGQHRLGFGSAIGVVLLAVLLCLTVILLRRRNDATAH